MKKRLLILTFSLGLLGFTQLQAAITGFCFTDAFGYTASVTATKTAIGHWDLSGTADVLTGYDWAITGSYDKGTDVWTLTYTNTAPDGCTFYVDYFTYTSYAYGGGVIYFNWTSYCFGGPLSSGSGSTTWSLGTCPLRLSDDVTPVGPISVDEAAYSMQPIDLKAIEGAPLFSDMFTEAELSVVKNNDNNYGIGYEVSSASDVTIDIFNHAGQYIATVVNGNQAEGFHTTSWDGKSANGETANAGIYIAVMRTDNGTITKKFVK